MFRFEIHDDDGDEVDDVVVDGSGIMCLVTDNR
jgi:hypothetical protein